MKVFPLLAVAAVSTGMLTASAHAEAAVTRGDYVVRLEAICKPRAEATARTMSGVRGDVEKHRLGVAAGKFEKASRIFGATVAAISAVPRPSADTSTLAKWFGDLKRQGRYLPKIAGRLRAGDAIKAQHLTAAFIHIGNEANRLTLAFGFNYCRFKFSRFS
jgi:hypothetical protein